ncbi:MAG: hypothetical protein IPP35_08770 [Elusimicrobia bacterium]|nr:hypothetical protein [Elusimicrobiota bacterium]
MMNSLTTKKIVEQNDVERFILPYENRGWERADMMVLRALSRQTRVIGYQHAAITGKHTEYCLSAAEALPLPDVLVSMGEVTAHMLTHRGGYPEGIVKSGCALRQKGGEVKILPPRRQPAHVLVLLSTSPDYYARTLFALNKIFKAPGGYSIRLRAHPLIPLKNDLRKTIVFPYGEDHSLEDDAIDWADVVLYSSSTTLVLNCVQRGKPVFYVPVDDYLDSTPFTSRRTLNGWFAPLMRFIRPWRNWVAWTQPDGKRG